METRYCCHWPGHYYVPVSFLVVEHRVIVDTKTIEAIGDIQVAQILTYLRFLKIRHGLILNFNTVLLKNGIKRVLNGFENPASQAK